MPKVIVVPQRDIDDKSREALQVTSLEAGHASPGQPLLLLSVGVFDSGVPDGHQYVFALSPPAAKRLSRDLRKAVKEYLQGKPDSDADG